ncbi:MAG: (2Fe-2S)-binding protein [Peptococcaceae bacterium]|nr:(2Fe-2S)-binding protein [Peptococcaceae bacterium]
MKGTEKISVKLMVNGVVHQIEASPRQRLLDFLRDDLDLKSVKEGCGVGDCGACTVLLDGKAVHSCLMMTVEADGHNVNTLEGLGNDGELSDLQQSFVDKGAIQCGFCTSGMILTAASILTENPAPSPEEIKRALAGNLCRCTGYQKIIEAVTDTAEKRRRA